MLVSSTPVYGEVYSIQPYMIEYFEDTKGIIRSLKLKDRQYNDQKKKRRKNKQYS